MKKYCKKNKKRSFILLEILIAISLISACMIPLLKNPINLYRKELKSLEALSFLKIEKEAIFEIKQLLLENKISWEDFTNRNREEATVRTMPKQLKIKGIKEKEVLVYYRIWTRQGKHCKNDRVCRKLFIHTSVNEPFKKNKNTSDYILHVVTVEKQNISIIN